jgi:hypothetical protein
MSEPIVAELLIEARSVGVSISEEEARLLAMPYTERSKADAKQYAHQLKHREQVLAFLLVSVVSRLGQAWLADQIAEAMSVKRSAPIHDIAARVITNRYMPQPPPVAGLGILVAVAGVVVTIIWGFSVGLPIFVVGLLIAGWTLLSFNLAIRRLRKNPDYAKITAHLRSVAMEKMLRKKPRDSNPSASKRDA